MFPGPTLLASNVVEIVPRYSSSHITLTCTVREANAKDYMIHLSCPFITSGFCFSNCKASCKFYNNKSCIRNPQINMISNCEFDDSDSSHISTTYRVKTSLINQTGDWMCVFKNYKSNVISLVKYEVPITTTLSTTTSSTVFQRKTITVIEEQPTEGTIHS